LSLQNDAAMSLEVSQETTHLVPTLLSSTGSFSSLQVSVDFPSARVVRAEAQAQSRGFIEGLKRRLKRERRRRKVGRAYDMALEMARLVPRGSEVLDVGCGNGFIAHHLSAMLGQPVVGIDVTETTEASIDYRPFDGVHFPVADNSVNAVLLCYVLHHAQDVRAVLSEVRRVLRDGGVVMIYEDIPETFWDKAVCFVHNRQWKDRTGPCTFRYPAAWSSLFKSEGFEIVAERRLARARNFTHPVSRRFYQLQLAYWPFGSTACKSV